MAGRHAEPATVREWTGLLHHLRLTPGEHHLGLATASFADANGTRVFPGVDRLAVVTGLSRRSVMRHLGVLVELGLLQKVRSGNVRGRADEYRLMLPDDIPDGLLRTPAQLDLEIEQSRGTSRREYKARHTGTPVRDTSDTYSPVDNPPVRDTDDTYSPAEDRDVRDTSDSNSPMYVTNGAVVRVAGVTTPTTDLDTSTTHHSEEILRTAVTQSRAQSQDPKSQDEDQPPTRAVGVAPAPHTVRCPHGLVDTGRTDGRPSCAICRRESIRSTTTQLALVPRTA